MNIPIFQLENISIEISQLTQRSLLSAAYIVYLPDVTEPQARYFSKIIVFAILLRSLVMFINSSLDPRQNYVAV